MWLLITGFAAEFRAGNYDFGRNVQVLTVCKAVSAVSNTISMDSNIRTGPLKLGKMKCIIPLEIVLYRFGKDDLPVGNKQLAEVDIPKLLWMKGLKKRQENMISEVVIGHWLNFTSCKNRVILNGVR